MRARTNAAIAAEYVFEELSSGVVKVAYVGVFSFKTNERISKRELKLSYINCKNRVWFKTKTTITSIYLLRLKEKTNLLKNKIFLIS